MFESIQLVFYRKVYLNFKNFKKLKRLVRPISGTTLLSCAVDLSVSLFHFREHFESVQRYSRADIERRCSAYELVGDVANAFKHANLTSTTPHGLPHITSASDVHELDILIGFLDEQGPYWHTEKCVAIKHSLHPGLILDNFLVEVYNFWRTELDVAGVYSFPTFRRFPPIGERYIPRTKARLGSVETMQGLPFQSNAQITIFDPEKNKAVPFQAASNLRLFSKRFVDIRIKFADVSEPISLGKYDPPDDVVLDSLLNRIKGVDVSQLAVALKDYGIDLWGLVRDRFGTSANGRNAVFELQEMNALNVPAGSGSITRRPGS